MYLEFNYQQAKNLVELFEIIGDENQEIDNSVLMIVFKDGNELNVYASKYPEGGSVQL